VTIWLTEDEHRTLTAALGTVLPGDGISPGAGEMGGADYVDQLLGAFSFDPPRIWAGGPFSGRKGGEASFDQWLELGALDELAWRTRIEGSQGRPEREFNGPVVGWQSRYRDGLAALGPDFADLDEGARRARLADAADSHFRDLLFEHACEALYGDPVYGGNRNGQAWDAIAFDGDVQPRGWTDDEVTHPS
jgi:Gluconate 2-dehydrogenase subunit 3